MILTVGCHKGGVGKTTTAVMLALQLAQTGPTVLIDADNKQGSATTWARMAGRSWPEALAVVPWQDPMTVPPAWASHVVIDTQPADPEKLRAALELSDMALLPIGARRGDVVQLRDTVTVVEEVASRRPLSWGVLLTFVRLSTNASREAPAAIERDEFPLLRTIIPLSAATEQAFGTVPRLYYSYRDVFNEVMEVTSHA